MSPTAKHDAVEASRPQTGSIPYLQHIDPPGPAVRWQSAAWCTDATKEQLAQTVAPASIDSTRFAHRARCERSNCFATGSRRAIKRPTYTGNNRLSEFVPQFHKTADKPANGSALTLLRDRCGLYGLGALGSSAFLDGHRGLSTIFARRFVSHCRSLIRSGNHLPPTIRQKKIKRHLPRYFVLFTGVHSFLRGSARSRGGIVGSPQPGIGCLSDFSKGPARQLRHHGDNNESSDVEVCDERRAH